MDGVALGSLFTMLGAVAVAVVAEISRRRERRDVTVDTTARRELEQLREVVASYRGLLDEYRTELARQNADNERLEKRVSELETKLEYAEARIRELTSELNRGDAR